MNVTVKVFAAIRDAAGASEVTLDVAEEATIGEVRVALSSAYPQVSALIARALFAVDARYAQDDELVVGNSDVACIPPVSGG